MTTPKPPAGLSPWARRVWRDLGAVNDFADHELLVFEKALRWWDLGDRWLAESESAEGRARGQLVKQAVDATQTALRYWRTLKFPAPDGVRRPGRPSGEHWSEARRRGAVAWRRMLRGSADADTP